MRVTVTGHLASLHPDCQLVGSPALELDFPACWRPTALVLPGGLGDGWCFPGFPRGFERCPGSECEGAPGPGQEAVAQQATGPAGTGPSTLPWHLDDHELLLGAVPCL